ncbi:hypothetical protein AYO43_10380 [Nitrospira sp. SCGC AG-212-E16]|nr:hypothetical protein AYO43_10380 [Nitrospira sp. SCGC AG-212-E16]
MREMWEYVSTLLWQSAVDVPKSIGFEWSTALLSAIPAALLWFIQRLREYGWRGLVTLPRGRQEWFTDIGLPVGVWVFVLLAIFVWDFLAAAIKRDTEQRTQIADQRTQIAELTKVMVSIDCLPVNLPVPGKLGEALHVIYLHPNALDGQLPYFMFGSVPEATFWPSETSRGAGYKCEILNDGSPLSKLRLAFKVDFGSAAGERQHRTIDFYLPPSRNNRPVFLYIANCTAWSPYVDLPETAIAQVRGAKEEGTISIEASSRRLGGFGQQDSPTNPVFCGANPGAG